MDHRVKPWSGTQTDRVQKELESEYVLQARRANPTEEDEEVALVEELGGRQGTVAPKSAESVQPCSAGTANSSGRTLPGPLQFAHDGPLARTRVDQQNGLTQILENTLKVRWAEANSGPSEPLTKMLEGSDVLFR